MRLVAQRVQKKNVEPLKLMKRRLGYFAVIGEIRGAPKAETVNFRLAMNQPHRLEARSEKLYWTIKMCIRDRVKKWPDGKNITLVLHKDSEGETETLERLIKMSPGELKALTAAHKDSVVIVDSDADVLKMIQSTPGAVGLVEIHSIDNSVNVVKVDGKLPMESGYLPH